MQRDCATIARIDAEVLVDGALHYLLQCLAGLRKHKGLRFVRPFQLERSRKRRDPYLSDGSVRCDDELARRILENDVEGATLFFRFEVALFFSTDEAAFQRFERSVCLFAE